MRTRRPKARGTRNSSGVISGVSWATNPSGVTIDQYGITIDTGSIAQAELEYLDGAAGYVVGSATAGKLCVSGVSYWAGTTVVLTTGLTVLDQIIAFPLIESAVVTQALYVNMQKDGQQGASAALNYNPQGAGASLATLAIAPGCSISFVAFGT